MALISVAESLDTATAAGRLVITIMGAVSQWEREAIGERTRDAFRHKRAQGHRTGNIPFGYRLGPDGRTLEPESAEQQAISEAQRLGRDGLPLRSVATRLNESGHRTRRGGPWRLESVVRVLRQSASAA